MWSEHTHGDEVDFDFKTDDEQQMLDREWFISHPHRTIRFRPARGSEKLGGSLTLVAKIADDLRLRYSFRVRPDVPWIELNEDEDKLRAELPGVFEVIEVEDRSRCKALA